MDSSIDDSMVLFKICDVDFKVTSAVYQAWHSKFSKDYISKSLPLAELWIFVNSAKRPIKDVPSFLTNWLIRGSMMRRY